MRDSERPDPEELLGRVKAEEAREGKGSLKIFFGMAPGVGKTYAMLESAHRLRKEGVDVVVGCIESHGRGETAALVDGLEVLSQKAVEYRGAKLDEFDLDAAIARHPKVLLLDELAHTNAPGSVHKKRWQDVMDLLDAGIDVMTTLNVQHIASLNDVVREVTGIRVRETVPDAALERADEMELVDLPPDELLQRLAEGKVYVAEQAARAKDRFFRRGNLLALRELALRHTAQHVDADVQAYRREHAIDKTWASGERILVAVGPAPASAGLVRAARRMADRLRAPWVAASVESSSTVLTPSAAKRLDANLALASDLGADVVRLPGERVSEVLISYAKKRNVTRIVIGKPTHSKIRDFVRGSLLDEVVRASATIDVLVTNGSENDEVRTAHAEPVEKPPPAYLPYIASCSAVIAATVVGLLVRSLLAMPDLVMLYLLAIVGVAVRYTRGPSILASALSVAAFDFFFVPPFLTFAVTDARHLLTFAMMFLVGILISGLMLRIRRQETNARLREERTAGLYALTRALGGATSDEDIAVIVARHVEDTFDCDAAVRIGRGDRPAAVEGDGPGRAILGAKEVPVARWVEEHGKPAGLGTDTLSGAAVFVAPLAIAGAARGIVAIRPKQAGVALDREQQGLLDSLLRQAGLALERARLGDEARAAAVRAKAEELRASLLSAVSHDLRTPLAAITGAATTLLDPESHFSSSERTELLTAINDEAERLERLVGNLLDMTRIDSGGVAVKREWVPIEELVGSAITRLEKQLAGRVVTTSIPAELPLVAVDPVVFAQVFVNLIENATKHTPAGSAIDISARAEDGSIVVEVADRGTGVPEAFATRVFDKFFRAPGASSNGVGLGLAICRGIVEAHGGTITAANREGGGAIFRVTLPIVGEAPEIPSEPPSSRRELSP